MTGLATKTFLSHIKSLYPFPYDKITHSKDVFKNPWDIVAAVTFSASNTPEGVPHVFNYALDDLAKVHTRLGVSARGDAAREDRLLLARRFREAIFKSGITAGYARSINGLVALYEVMPEELRETGMLRNPRIPLEEHRDRGDVVFQSMYGHTGPMVQGIMDDIHPDLGYFSRFVAYGYVFGHFDVLSQADTSYSLVASLIAGDTPRQTAWHLENSMRAGASLEEAQAVRSIAMEVSCKAGVRWKHGVPEINSVGYIK